MIARIASRIADALTDNEIINDEERQLYEFGLHQGIVLLVNAIAAIIIGISFGMLWQMIAFLVFFVPIRMYSGGIHAKNQLVCFIVTVITMILMLVIMR